MADVEGPQDGADGSTAARVARLLELLRDQRVAFVIVGGINTVLGIGFFALFQRLIGHSAGYMVSLVLSHIAAVLCAFVLHRRFVFKVRGRVLTDLLRFEMVNLTNLAASAVCLPLAVEILHADPVAAQAAITCATVLLSYFGHKHFSFRR